MVKKSLLWVYRTALALLWFIIIALACSVLMLRYGVLPHIDQYKQQIAERASAAIGQKITIGDIVASWDGLNPHFSLHNVDLYDAQARPALSLSHVEASLSWLSIPLMEPRLSAIIVHQPELTIRREKDGVIYVAGISMSGPARPEFPNWLLRQSQIDILGATILWQDDLRAAPALTLTQLDLQLQSPAWEALLGHHRFALRAIPSAGSSQPIDLRGNVYGSDVARPEDWSGTLYGKLEGTEIAAWRQWLDYPFDLREGFGAARFWLNFDDGKPLKLTSDVILYKVKTRLAKNSPEASLNTLRGRLKWQHFDDGQEIRAEGIQMATGSGFNTRNGNFALRERTQAGKTEVEGNLQLDELDLQPLTAFAAYLPLPKDTLEKITAISPAGQLEKLQLRWKGDPDWPAEYSIDSRFRKLSIQAWQHIPGFNNLSGSITADEDGGSLNFNAEQAALDFKGTLRWPIPAQSLNGQVRWSNGKNGTEVHVNNFAIASEHLAGSLSGSYMHNGVKGGQLDLHAKFNRADGKFARYYFPTILGEETLHWLDTSILAAHGEDVNVIVKGNVDDFPYDNGKPGLFKVTAKISDGVLDFANDWPKIENLKLDMLFQGNRMELNVLGGTTLGNQISKGKAIIPALDAQHPVLQVLAEGQDNVVDGLRYVNGSPLKDSTGSFTKDLHASGSGKLNLELLIPLDNIDATKVKAVYAISNGSLQGDGFPELSKINGKLEFTESSLRAQNVSAWLYGGPTQFNLSSDKEHVIHISAGGRVSDSGLKQAFGGLADRLSGSTDWSGDITILQDHFDLDIRSTLLGMASNLPAPLGKPANERGTLRIEKRQQAPQQDIVSINYGNNVIARLLRIEQSGQMQVERGEIGINVAPEIPAQGGIGLRGTLDEIDLDEWRNLFDKSAGGSAVGLSRIDLAVNTLDVFDRRINALKLNARASGDSWQMNVQSREINGDVQWLNQGSGKVIARLKDLIMPSASPDAAPRKLEKPVQLSDKYPALDITADNFEVGKKKLGRLELTASEQNSNWNIDKLRIVNPDSTLSGDGEWRNWRRNPNTRMNISWQIGNVGKTLERFGYPNTIKDGNGDISGQLRWPGSPHEFDIVGLSGNLKLDIQRGQVLKIEPGVGRLLGLVTLQSLPRRLTLDFRDLFNSGFTFDKISTTLNIDRGIMRSDDFRMQGPAALVEIKGETDLQKETQHLFVKVTPYISDSLSLAALAGGPAAAAAAFLAQKILKDPFNKLVADEYEIIGTWDKPVEVKSDSKVPTQGTSPLGK